MMCRGGRTRSTAYYGSGEGCVVRFFRIRSQKLYLLVRQRAQMMWMSGGKDGEIVSPSLFLLHANKCSYR